MRKSGTSMELLVLGGLYLIMASAREDHSVKVAKRQNSLNCKCRWRSEAAVVIWKSENSRNRVSNVPAQYFSQLKGWMKGEILDTVLSKLNQQLRSKGCSIMLLMDNAIHQKSSTNIETLRSFFFPPTQPPSYNLNIIQNFKVTNKN